MEIRTLGFCAKSTPGPLAKQDSKKKRTGVAAVCENKKRAVYDPGDEDEGQHTDIHDQEAEGQGVHELRLPTASSASPLSRKGCPAHAACAENPTTR